MMRKKLIEVALPLEAINTASAREKSIRHGHPSTLHLWWARRPLAAARAVIFAQMVDDPSSLPDLFPTEKKQQKERERLFKIIEDLVQWENTTNEQVLERARAEIWQSWRRACADNADHPQAKELFDRNKLPAFHDPFAGGGALPLEAQRLGLEAWASDVNPVAVLINKALIEIPPRFAGRSPVNPESREKSDLIRPEWSGARGLAEDVRYYGKWMRDEAEKRIGHLYPKVEITAAMAKSRPDLTPFVGQRLTVIAWIWARTVKSPNPAFADVRVPLASTFMLSTKSGKEAYVEPVIEKMTYKFVVKIGKPKDPARAERGTKAGGSGSIFRCLLSDSPIPFEYVRSEAKAGRLSQRLIAIVAECAEGRVYLSPSEDAESTAQAVNLTDPPDGELPSKALGFRVQEYGMTRWRDLYTRRQLELLTTLTGLVAEVGQRIERDAVLARVPDSHEALVAGGSGARAYAEAVLVYLGEAVSKLATFHNQQAYWRVGEGKSSPAFGRQAIPMTWDYTEVQPFARAGGDFGEIVCNAAPRVIAALAATPAAHAEQADAAVQSPSTPMVVSTDPPYYDNVPYADLSDFFYVWLRRSLRAVFPDLFATVETPKSAELVASPFRHGGKDSAENFFLTGMTKVMQRISRYAHPGFPVTVYYAFKQTESDDEDGASSTGWETFLEALIAAGFALTGTWPVRTEGKTRMRGKNSNALASSIVLVCRPRIANAAAATRREFAGALRQELPEALRSLQNANIAPVDLAQAAIGPGMAIYTRFAKVLDAEGKPVSVREALALINQVLDETLAEQEGEFDADSRWALTWFEEAGFVEGEYGRAEQLSKSKNTSVGGLVDAGVIESKKGKVRLLKPDELPKDWDPETDKRLTAWETVHHLMRLLSADGEGAAATIVAKLGGKAETARDLAYRLYSLCERKKRANEALAYNALVQSWPEITRLAREGGKPKQAQPGLFQEPEE